MSMFNRRTLLSAAGAAGLAAAAGSTTGQAPARLRADRRPNILMIVTDQEFGLSSYPKGLLGRLPAKQKLLSKGLLVENYHVQTTPCSPSRSNIFAGQHTQKTGVYVNSDTSVEATLPLDMATLGDMLREAGYYTSYKGKWHLSNINGPRNWRGVPGGVYPNSERALEGYGFGDYNFNGEEVGLTWAGYQSDQLVAGDAARLIVDYARSDKSQERPWFLVVNLINPHDIMFYDATGKQAASRPSPDMLAPVKREPVDRLYTEDLGYDLPESFYKDDLSTKPEAHSAIVRLNNRFYGQMDRSDVASWRRFTNYYYNCLRDVDRHLDTLLWTLDYSSQADNTVILYTTDHGERAAAHGMRQKAGTTYKEETNVPMIIAHPDGAGGRTTKGLMSAIDIAPTLLAFAGRDRGWTRERYPDLKGVDVSPLVGDARARTERDRRGHLFNYAVQHMWEPIPPEPGAPPGPARYDLSKRRLHRGVHDGRYKFARYFAPAQHHAPQTWEELARLNDLELYDTAADPNEINNLAHRPDTVKPTLMRLNAMTNALVREEVGRDDGSEYPGPTEQYNTVPPATRGPVSRKVR